MKTNDPLAGKQPRKLVAKDDYAAGNAQEYNVKSNSSADPDMDLEEALAEFRLFGVFLPKCHGSFRTVPVTR